MTNWISDTGTVARMRLDDVLVIDLDVHLLDRGADIAEYCEQPWRRVLEEGQPVPPYGGKSRLFPNFPGQWQGRRPVATNPTTLRADLDALSVDACIVFPEDGLKLARQPNPAYAMAVARAYNRWVAERYLSSEDGIYGGILIAPQDPEGSANEVRRWAADDGVLGIVFPTSGVDPFWGDPRYEPIYRALADCGLTALYHAGGQLAMHVVPFRMEQFRTHFEEHAFSHNIGILTSMTNLLAHGVPQRYPDLQMVFIEGGVSWAPIVMHQLDWAWRRRRSDVPSLKRRPSDYIRRQMYVSTQPIEEPERASDMAAFIRSFHGEEIVVFASDYPHHDFDHPKKVHDIPLDPEARARIMGGNALRALHLVGQEARLSRSGLR